MRSEQLVSFSMKQITEVAERAGIPAEFIEPYGKYMAKIDLRLRKTLGERKGKLILVTATTPTKAGEGKTTTSIGLSMALNKLGHNTVVTLREPSLGPVFGVKGGAAGGGKSQVLPAERINLLFTADFPAVSAAHSLLSAMIDNHVYHGNELGIDVRRIYWPRAVDMNDRALRNIIVGLGGRKNGYPREESFVITPASEIMAILALAKDYPDLKERLGRILVARNHDLKEVFARDLRAEGAMSVILRDAMKPNLVQTSEGTPAIIHAGPFANIAHGTNSVVATDIALRLFDYVVIEAGFGADLGAEKFINIVTRAGGYSLDGVVVVTTMRALKLHGDGDLKAGLPNLEKHMENIAAFGLPAVVALNKFPDDTDEEIDILRSYCSEHGWSMEVSEVYVKGGDGALDLASAVVKTLENSSADMKYTYDLEDGLATKIEKVATKVYGADGVTFGDGVKRKIRSLEKRGYKSLPICIAKTQYSLSDNPKLIGRPSGFKVFVRDVDVSAGAGFVIVYMGDVNLMPGLPKEPSAFGMSLDDDGTINGVF
ncbi:MAG: formate--tetrahydrofolate ligase [Candidatus Thorarchaeota archaeon]|nr:formate--tetrahydrofolate ligase [Candidatus Thorarchaeota archaeon]